MGVVSLIEVASVLLETRRARELSDTWNFGTSLYYDLSTGLQFSHLRIPIWFVLEISRIAVQQFLSSLGCDWVHLDSEVFSIFKLAPRIRQPQVLGSTTYIWRSPSRGPSMMGWPRYLSVPPTLSSSSSCHHAL